MSRPPISGWSQRLAPIRAVTKSKGLAPWTLHDLRRTMRTGLGRLGVDQEIAELMLNHAVSNELQAVYDRGDYWTRRREAADRWAQHVIEKVEPGIPGHPLPIEATTGSSPTWRHQG